MKLNNVEYNQDAVVAVAASGPTVEIDASDLDMENFPILSKSVEVKLPVFYKYNGKFIVLLGQELVVNALMAKKTKVKGKLVSSPMLKKAKVEDRPSPPPQQPRYEDAFANRPRIVNKSERPQHPRAERPEGARPVRVYNGPRGPKF